MAATQGRHDLQSAEDAFSITPDDGNDVAIETRGLVAQVAGNVKVTMKTGATVTLGIAAGVVIPVRVTRVWATGTTATGLVGLV